MDSEKNLSKEVEALTERLEKAKYYFREQKKEIEALKKKNEEYENENKALSDEIDSLKEVNKKASEENKVHEAFKKNITAQLKKVISDFSAFLDEIEKQ